MARDFAWLSWRGGGGDPAKMGKLGQRGEGGQKVRILRGHLGWMLPKWWSISLEGREEKSGGPGGGKGKRMGKRNTESAIQLMFYLTNLTLLKYPLHYFRSSFWPTLIVLQISIGPCYHDMLKANIIEYRQRFALNVHEWQLLIDYSCPISTHLLLADEWKKNGENIFS